MKPTANLIESVARRLTPSVTDARMHESLEITADEEKAIGEYQKLHDQHDAAVRHLDQIHGQIATHAQVWPSDVRHIHGASASTAANMESAIKEKHEKQLEKLPEAARPPARLLMDALIKHAKFMHGVVQESKQAAMAAHPWNKKAT